MDKMGFDIPKDMLKDVEDVLKQHADETPIGNRSGMPGFQKTEQEVESEFEQKNLSEYNEAVAGEKETSSEPKKKKVEPPKDKKDEKDDDDDGDDGKDKLRTPIKPLAVKKDTKDDIKLSGGKETVNTDPILPDIKNNQQSPTK